MRTIVTTQEELDAVIESGAEGGDMIVAVWGGPA